MVDYIQQVLEMNNLTQKIREKVQLIIFQKGKYPSLIVVHEKTIKQLSDWLTANTVLEICDSCKPMTFWGIEIIGSNQVSEEQIECYYKCTQ